MTRWAAKGGDYRRRRFGWNAAPAPTCQPRRPPLLSANPQAAPAAGTPPETISPALYERLLGDVNLRPGEVAWGQVGLHSSRPATAALAGWLPHHPDWQSEGRGRELPAEAPLFVALRPPKATGGKRQSSILVSRAR